MDLGSWERAAIRRSTFVGTLCVAFALTSVSIEPETMIYTGSVVSEGEPIGPLPSFLERVDRESVCVEGRDLVRDTSAVFVGRTTAIFEDGDRLVEVEMRPHDGELMKLACLIR